MIKKITRNTKSHLTSFDKLDDEESFIESLLQSFINFVLI